MEMNETVKNFLIRLSDDKELYGKFEAAAKRQDRAECALLSKEAGFNFTKADLEYMENLGKVYQNGELTETQLEMVTGGCAGFIPIGAIGVILGGLIGHGS